jgi:hypothetical protein
MVALAVRLRWRTRGAWLGKAGRDTARHGPARRGVARQGKGNTNSPFGHQHLDVVRAARSSRTTPDTGDKTTERRDLQCQQRS